MSASKTGTMLGCVSRLTARASCSQASTLARSVPCVSTFSATSRSSPSLTANDAWCTRKLIGTTGWSVVIATRTPAAASRPRLAIARCRSSTFDRLVNSGPKITGMSFSASTSAMSAPSVPWLTTSRYPNSSDSRIAVAALRNPASVD